MTVHQQLAKKFMLPILATTIFCIVGYFVVSPLVSHGASRDEWADFLTRHIRDFHDNKNDLVVVGVLLCLQFIHTVLCVPFINATQTTLGFIYGWWQGGLLSGAWECVIISVFVWCKTRKRATQGSAGGDRSDFLQQFVFFLRGKRALYPFVLVAQMSSIPINSTVLLIGDNAVTALEYLSVHFTVSCFNAFKNTFVGYRIYHSRTDLETWRLGEIMLFIVIMPSILSLMVCCAALVFYNKLYCVPPPAGPLRGGLDREMCEASASPKNLVTPYANTLVYLFRQPVPTAKHSTEELAGLIADATTSDLDKDANMSPEDPDAPVWAFEASSSTIRSVSTMTQLYDVVAYEAEHVSQTPNNSRSARGDASPTQPCLVVHVPTD